MTLKSDEGWPRRECRSCGASIIWSVTKKNGKRMPMDADPIPQGKWTLEPGPDLDTPAAVYLGHESRYTGPRYESHFGTCPNAAQHRLR